MSALREKILDYALDYFGTNPDYPWESDPESLVLRHPENKKWYALIMRIPREKLCPDEIGQVDILNIKCDPIALGSLLKKDGCHPAYHMSKAHWLTIRLDGSVDYNEIVTLLNMSYAMTIPKSESGNQKSENR